MGGDLKIISILTNVVVFLIFFHLNAAKKETLLYIKQLMIK